MKRFVNHVIFKESINVDTINQLVYSLYNLLKKYSEKWHKGYYNGYYKIEGLEEKFSQAYDFLVNLQKQKFNIQSDSKCVCEQDIALLMEQVRLLTGSCSSLRIDLIEDKSGYAEWVLANPDKVAREAWEECLFTKCDKVTFTLVRQLKDCKLAYDLVKTIKDCGLKYDVKKSEVGCELEYELMKKSTNCELSYKDFVVFHKCGGTVDLIKKATDCAVGIEVNQSDKCIDLTYNLKKYPIC